MPELPEVEVVRRGLQAWVAGRTILGAEVLHRRAVRRQADDLHASVSGRTVACASRRGKYLWLPLSDGTQPAAQALVAHLGMSGQLLIQPVGAADEPHLRVRFTLADARPESADHGDTDASSAGELRFVDQRTFGGLMTAPLVDDGRGGRIPEVIAHIAPDPMDPSLDLDAVIARFRARRTEIKRALLDQSLLSGIGNIYADEALWRARLHGSRLASALRPAVLRGLLGHVREVMEQALEQGGTSFDALYVNVNGQSGYFDRSLRAYGQEGRPCQRCGTPIRRERFMNRSSFSCGRCQRPPSRSTSATAGPPAEGRVTPHRSSGGTR
ncbi:MAG: bifunctional DNA-formamidopyrimidine glycosylase/DNA-(apurinic or apyrimidinic site) lyase [Actinomycetales bacterium]|nr:bifunctional DNA-formamidopyrimidine glycosylase/DNA-(apurinic or apyrimidinic site) lyase [Actinomycetales bacterium]